METHTLDAGHQQALDSLARLHDAAEESAQDARRDIAAALSAAWEAGQIVATLAPGRLPGERLQDLAEQSGVPFAALHRYLRTRRRYPTLDALLEGGARQLCLFDDAGEVAPSGEQQAKAQDEREVDLTPIFRPIERGVGRLRKLAQSHPIARWDRPTLERAWAHLRSARDLCLEIERVMDSRR
jgi:hypothetical protein